MLRKILLAAAVVQGVSSVAGQARKNTHDDTATSDPILDGILEGGAAIQTIRPHLDAVKELAETTIRLQEEAKQKFGGGTYTGDEAGKLFEEMGVFLQKTQKKLDPLAAKVKSTVPTNQELKSATSRINAGLAPLAKMLEDAQKTANTPKSKPVLNGTATQKLQQRIQRHVKAQESYLVSLQEFHAAIESKADRIEKGFQLLLKTGRLAEEVKETELPKSDQTAEIKALQAKIDPLVMQLRERFKNSKNPKPKTTQQEDEYSPHHDGLRRRM